MPGHYYRFQKNIERVDALLSLYSISKQSSTRPNVKEADLLRAAVVFLHSALEDYIRGIITEWLPVRGSSINLDDIALLGLDERPKKFFLGSLKEFSNLTVSELIKQSIYKHMSKVSFNDIEDIYIWLKKIDFDISSFQDQESVDKMIKRRHKIVHEADMNERRGYGYHYASSINVPTIAAWKESVQTLVNNIEAIVISLLE